MHSDYKLHNSLSDLCSSLTKSNSNPKIPANAKTDAECLNQMVTTMSSKLKLSETKSLEDKLANSGNIFYNRTDWLGILNQLPLDKQNSIHIRLEDEGPYGNDDTRCFVLSHFSKLCVREMKCVLCNDKLSIYDRFPLIDGTMFTSPIKYDIQRDVKDINNNTSSNISSETNQEECKEPLLFVEAHISNKLQYIYAICLNCLHSKNDHVIKCKQCNEYWKGGANLQVGTLYKFEIFAPFICCQSRLNCSKCSHPIVNLKSNSTGLPFFSSYSEEKECSNCKAVEYHLIKQLDQFFQIV
jgi:hypothetical protein